jgi:hypothetical protein
MEGIKMDRLISQREKSEIASIRAAEWRLSGKWCRKMKFRHRDNTEIPVESGQKYSQNAP